MYFEGINFSKLIDANFENGSGVESPSLYFDDVRGYHDRFYHVQIYALFGTYKFFLSASDFPLVSFMKTLMKRAQRSVQPPTIINK